MAMEIQKVNAQSQACWALENIIHIYADMQNALAELEAGRIDTIAVINDGIARRFGMGIDREALTLGAPAFDVSDYTFDAFLVDYEEDDEEDADYAPTCEAKGCKEKVYDGWCAGDIGMILCESCVYVIDLRRYID